MWCRSCRTFEIVYYLNFLPTYDLSNTEQYPSDSAAFVMVLSRFWGGAQPSGKQHAAWQYLLYNFYVPWLSCKNVAFISKQGEILNARGIINLLISPRICLSLNLQSDHIRSLRGCVTIRQSADGLDVPKIAKRLFWAPCLFRRWNGSLVTSKSPLEVCLFENQRTDPNLNFNNSSLNRTVREEVWE
jgi:hypothetical protein